MPNYFLASNDHALQQLHHQVTTSAPGLLVNHAATVVANLDPATNLDPMTDKLITPERLAELYPAWRADFDAANAAPRDPATVLAELVAKAKQHYADRAEALDPIDPNEMDSPSDNDWTRWDERVADWNEHAEAILGALAAVKL